MRPQIWLKVLRRGWLALFVLAALGFLVPKRTQLFGEVQQLLESPRFLFAATLLQLGVILAAALSWRLLVKRQLGHDLAFLSAVRHFLLLNLGKYLPGKAWGMVARGGELVDRGATTGDVVYATLLEQYVLLVAAGSIAFAMIGYVLSGTAAALALLLVTLVLGWSLQRAVLRLWTRWRRRDISPSALLSSRTYAQLAVLSTGGWVCNGLVVYWLAAQMFGSIVGPTMLFAVVAATAVSVSIGFLALFAPAGLGVREGSLAWLLLPWLPLTDGLALAFAHRAWLILWDVLFALVLLLPAIQRLFVSDKASTTRKSDVD